MKRLKRTGVAEILAVPILIIVSVFAVGSSATTLECLIGWGSTGTHKIPEDQINDGYCDCPLDGSDEPLTNACSGSTVGAFTGIAAVSTRSTTYQCPQQKKVKIPFSRFHDGICDCCDGSDEPPTVCPDICDQVLAEERALREKMAREFSVGQKKRQTEIEKFKVVLANQETEKIEQEGQLEVLKEQIAEVESELNQVKHEYMQQRVDRTTTIATRVANHHDGANKDSSTGLTGLLEPLPNEELVELMVHSCQLVGEMEDNDFDDSTCVPLRLAGLDAALVWSREFDGKAKVKRLHLNVREEGKLLADMMIHNAQTSDDHDKHFMEDDIGNRKHRKRNRRNRPGRRRLMEAITDDEVINDHFYGDNDDDDDPYPDDYIPDEEFDDYDEHHRDMEDQAEDEPDDNAGDEDDESKILNVLKESLFSQPRVAFLQRSREIIAGIENLLKKKEKKEESEEEANEVGEDDRNAYNAVKSTLEDRERAIERGYDYAVSAKVLLTALSDSSTDQEILREELQKLAIGTVTYGKLSAAQVWQLFQAILEEFHPAESSDSAEKTCATSPWAVSCPPRSIAIDSVMFPPKQILDAAQHLCTTPTFTKEIAEACAAEADNEVPKVMPDGYYGYEVVKPRDDKDILQKIAGEWDAPIDEATNTELDDLQSKIDKLEGERKRVEGLLDDISDLVQGANDSKFGDQGELYSLKDKCFSVKAGKYTYEVCVFGSAAQKEADTKSGTSLGQWDGADFDNETGKRILKWTNGIKCWNGPKRSATAYVTCGAETKVLSADEPDTCRYVLQMESHIACDDAFRELHEL